MAMSNAVQLMRHHKHDWIMVLLLMGIAGILSILPPFNRFIGKNMLEDLTYPYKEETIPFWIVQIIAVGIPPIIFLTYFFHRKDVNDLHNSILGLLFSIFTTVVISDTMKDAVGRPRPDFFWRCFPDGTPAFSFTLHEMSDHLINTQGFFQKFDNVTGEVVCHGNPKIIREGHKSFPSGHTSWAFSGLGFLSLYLAAKIQLFDNKGHPVKLTIVFLPLLVGTLIAISRVDDYRHHWQDVFAGAFLGLTMATLCYRQFFPAPYEPNAAVPFHCYAMLTGQASVTECDVAVNLENGQYYRLATEESVYENQ